MVMVWVRDGRVRSARFHRSPDCRNLRKRPARGTVNVLLALDLDEVLIRPCLTCYPDAPRIKMTKRYCLIHDSPMPCEHNGGVLVPMSDGRSRHVWPDSNTYLRHRRLSIASTTSTD